MERLPSSSLEQIFQIRGTSTALFRFGRILSSSGNGRDQRNRCCCVVDFVWNPPFRAALSSKDGAPASSHGLTKSPPEGREVASLDGNIQTFGVPAVLDGLL